MQLTDVTANEVRMTYLVIPWLAAGLAFGSGVLIIWGAAKMAAQLIERLRLRRMLDRGRKIRGW